MDYHLPQPYEQNTYGFYDSPTSRFPTSSARSEPLPPRRVSPPTQPVASTSTSNSSCYSQYVPKEGWPVELWRGYKSNGTITANLPSVQTYLDTVNETGIKINIKKRPSHRAGALSDPRLFSLAALDVFNKPSSLAHWAFWNITDRRKTAETINSIYNAEPPQITSPITWSGVEDMLRAVRIKQVWLRHNVPADWWHDPLCPQAKLPRLLRSQTTADNAADIEDAPPRKKPRTRARLTHVKRHGKSKAENPDAAAMEEPTNATSSSYDVAEDSAPVLPPSISNQVIGKRKRSSMPAPAPKEPSKPTRVSARQRERQRAPSSTSLLRLPRSGSSTAVSRCETEASTDVEEDMVVEEEKTKQIDEENVWRKEDEIVRLPEHLGATRANIVQAVEVVGPVEVDSEGRELLEPMRRSVRSTRKGKSEAAPTRSSPRKKPAPYSVDKAEQAQGRERRKSRKALEAEAARPPPTGPRSRVPKPRRK